MAEDTQDIYTAPTNEKETSNKEEQSSANDEQDLTAPENASAEPGEPAEPPLTNKQRRQAKQAAKQAAMEEDKPRKQRRELDVLNRIRWDERYDPADIIIGYLDRHSEQGIIEIPFEAWERESTADEFIPLHRIKYFRRQKETTFLWHRTLGIDQVFGRDNPQVDLL